jgi:hypothetical protein
MLMDDFTDTRMCSRSAVDNGVLLHMFHGLAFKEGPVNLPLSKSRISIWRP